MSSFENVVRGKLKLKGKPLNVKAGGLKKKKHKHHRIDSSEIIGGDVLHQEGGSSESSRDPNDEVIEANKEVGDEGRPSTHDDHLTPAERRYIEQREKIDVRRLAKTANKSHRDRIQDFNQNLANMSEHYDIPKVGPG